SVGLHGANRLGSNSLAELVVFGRVAGEHAGIMGLGAAFDYVEALGLNAIRDYESVADALRA
ncbi:succinate dehydrogenase/fumarate reductase flavoprotein subunit, partial [Serratia ureilytica]|nr:succinate dehydrogenase/fumarate reductase flavoprotein subunit [Serratia ureilytica]